MMALLEEEIVSPVEVGSLSHYLQGFKDIPVPGGVGFLPSTVCFLIPRPTSGLPIRSRRTRGVTLEPSSGRFVLGWFAVS